MPPSLPHAPQPQRGDHGGRGGGHVCCGGRERGPVRAGAALRLWQLREWLLLMGELVRNACNKRACKPVGERAGANNSMRCPTMPPRRARPPPPPSRAAGVATSSRARQVSQQPLLLLACLLLRPAACPATKRLSPPLPHVLQASRQRCMRPAAWRKASWRRWASGWGMQVCPGDGTAPYEQPLEKQLLHPHVPQGPQRVTSCTEQLPLLTAQGTTAARLQGASTPPP